MKRCGRCKTDKPLDDFELRAKGGRQGYCKACLDAYKQEYYRRNREVYITRALNDRERVKKVLRSAKDKPCADCGELYPYYVMEFDHRDGETKVCNVSELNGHRRTSIRNLLAEIAKCDVVCANCHRERTHKRKQNVAKRYRTRLKKLL